MDKIAKALIAAKKEFSPVLKDKNNPFFKSKYADLGSCLEAVNDALLNNGIALYQQTFEDQTGVLVQTVMLHESGESINFGLLHVPAAKQDPQGYGSALTYARRYSLITACGIAPEDDDGNAASKPVKKSITPTSGVIDNLSTDQQTSAIDDAALICSLWDSGDKGGAFGAYQELRSGDQEYLLGVWEALKKRSEVRSGLKKMHVEHQLQAGIVA